VKKIVTTEVNAVNVFTLYLLQI